MSGKVLLIHTGGTIGMQKLAEGYQPISGFQALLRSRLDHSHHAQLPDFDYLELDTLIDSANLEPAHWNQIAEKVIGNYQDYVGFVILHGTDTMSFSASALSFMLQGLGKPVIITGSQIPLSELRSDALDNLITALLLAGFYPINEVCIYFSGRLLRGNRSSKMKATGLDAFDSPNFPWLGQVGLHIELHTRLFLPEQAEQFSNPDFHEGAVAVLPIYPGMSAEMAGAICNTASTKALILQSYGVGNLPDKNSGLMTALQVAADNGTLIVNISRCPQAHVFQGQYACSQVLNDMGVIAGEDMTLEATFCKLHYLIATENDTSVIKDKLASNLVGEIDKATYS